MKNTLQQAVASVRAHRIAAVTVLFVLLGVIVGIASFPAINVHYVARFSGNVDVERQVTFQFDDNPGYSESATQSAYPDNGTATIHVDPLNLDSASLTVTAAGENVRLDRLDANVVAEDQTLYRAATIDLVQVNGTKATLNGSTATRFSIPAEQMKSLEKALAFRSEVKLLLLAFLLVLYLIVLCRMTIARHANKRYFAVSALVLLLVGGFVANVWLVKKPIVYHYSYAFTQPANIDDHSTYEYSQSFIAQQNKLRSVKLPISLDPTIDAGDVGNPGYGAVYETPHEYHNKYVITVTESETGSVLAKTMLTPDMVTVTNSLFRAEIPVRYDHAKGKRFTVTIDKTDSNAATVQFQGASLDTPIDILPQGSTPDSTELAVRSTIPFSYLNLSVGYAGYPYQAVMTAIVVAFLILILLNVLANRMFTGRQSIMLCAANYVCLIAYAIFQFTVYVTHVHGFPDELAHISYVAYLKQHGGLVPDFASMQIYNFNGDSTALDLTSIKEFNRLGHPPLFYQIERLLGGMSIDGNMAILHITRMRLVSFMLGLIGLAIVFYLGYSRIRKIPMLHLLFGLLVISPPNMIYTMSGVSNDSLTLLSMSVFVAGVIRYCERRYDARTFFLIAGGFALVSLSKLTAAMVAGFMGLGLVLYTIFRERNAAVFRKPAFLASLPVYVVPVGYFGWLLARYHAIQPSFQKLDFTGYVNSYFYVGINDRLPYSAWEYVTYYVGKFLDTWTSYVTNIVGSAQDTSMTGTQSTFSLFDPAHVGLIAILLIPVSVLFLAKSRVRDFLAIAETAFLITAVYQGYSAFRGFYDNGYPGAYSSRYYLCVISVFAFAIIWMICRSFSRSQETQLLDDDRPAARLEPVPLTSLGTAICLVFIVLLVFDGFLYSLLYQADGITGFVGKL